MASYTQPASSSGGFIGDGVPHAAAFISSLDSKSMVEAAVEVALKSGNDTLKKQLDASATWKEYADYIEIVWEDGEFSYTIDGPPEVEAAIYRLEYGDGDGTPPTAMLRKHAFRLAGETSKTVEAELNSALGLSDKQQQAAGAAYGV